MWELVTQGGGGVSLGGRVRGWGCVTMDMSRVASTFLRYVCPHLVDDRVKRQLVSELRDASITVRSDLDIKNVHHWSIK